jgi:hypothetical protein
LEIGTDGSVRIRRGVAEDRRVSIEDREMRSVSTNLRQFENGFSV